MGRAYPLPEPEPEDVDVHYDPVTSEVVVGAGVSHFYINIHGSSVHDPMEDTETYTIHLSDQQATGTLWNADPQ